MLAYRSCPAEWCCVTLNACASLSWLIQLILIRALFCLRIGELPLHARLHVISRFCLWVWKLLFSLTDIDVCVSLFVKFEGCVSSMRLFR